MCRRAGKRSFDETLKTRIGKGYAISKSLRQLCKGGCCLIILLSNDEKRRAEGTLSRLVPTKKALNGIQRYDVHMKGMREVRYKRERLNRNGIAVL